MSAKWVRLNNDDIARWNGEDDYDADVFNNDPEMELADVTILPTADLDEALRLLRETMQVADSHYAHHDPQGTAGLNCPACIARAEDRQRIRAFLSQHCRLTREGRCRARRAVTTATGA